MALDWVPRGNVLKDHQVFGDEHFGTEPPCTMFEKKLLVNPNTGETINGLYTAWITLNNPPPIQFLIDWSENINCTDKDLSTCKDDCRNIVFLGERIMNGGRRIAGICHSVR